MGERLVLPEMSYIEREHFGLVQRNYNSVPLHVCLFNVAVSPEMYHITVDNRHKSHEMHF